MGQNDTENGKNNTPLHTHFKLKKDIYHTEKIQGGYERWGKFLWENHEKPKTQ